MVLCVTDAGSSPLREEDGEQTARGRIKERRGNIVERAKARGVGKEEWEVGGEANVNGRSQSRCDSGRRPWTEL
jgi:hypothetical protein